MQCWRGAVKMGTLANSLWCYVVLLSTLWQQLALLMKCVQSTKTSPRIATIRASWAHGLSTKVCRRYWGWARFEGLLGIIYADRLALAKWWAFTVPGWAHPLLTTSFAISRPISQQVWHATAKAVYQHQLMQASTGKTSHHNPSAWASVHTVKIIVKHRLMKTTSICTQPTQDHTQQPTLQIHKQRVPVNRWSVERLPTQSQRRTMRDHKHLKWPLHPTPASTECLQPTRRKNIR